MDYTILTDEQLIALSKELELEISALSSKQHAIKILNNSLYGALSNQYFRFFNIEFARAITLTGQTIIQYVSQGFNDYLKTTLKTDNYQYAFYNDTDSIFTRVSPVVENFYADKPLKEQVMALDNICEKRFNPKLEELCSTYQNMTNAYKHFISFKREKIADKMLISSKKHYIMRYYNSEGVYYETPKYTIKGYEIIKSSTPKLVRQLLREIIETVMEGDKTKTKEIIQQHKQKFMNSSVEEISIPKSANNLKQYSSISSVYTKGCPLHDRGALLYNYHISRLKLLNKYELIKEGEKIKYIYLKMPNPIRENIISYVGELPKELGLHEYADYEVMFEKVYAAALDNVIGAIGWKTTEPTGFDI